MKKKRQNSHLKIIACIGLCVFSFISCALGTLCWFSANQKNNASGENIKVMAPAGFLKQITVHHYLTLDDDTFIFNKNYESRIYQDIDGSLVYEGASSLVLGTYTPFEKEHPALILIELDGEIANNLDAILSMSIRTESEYLGKTNEDGTLARKITQVDNAMSSVIRFAGFYMSNDSELEAFYSTFEGNDSIDIPKSTFGTMDHFVDIAADGGSYTSYVKNKNVINFEDDAVAKYIAIVMDYYPESMEYIYGLNIGNPVLSNMESNVGFRCDWELVF